MMKCLLSIVDELQQRDGDDDDDEGRADEVSSAPEQEKWWTRTDKVTFRWALLQRALVLITTVCSQNALVVSLWTTCYCRGGRWRRWGGMGLCFSSLKRNHRHLLADVTVLLTVITEMGKWLEKIIWNWHSVTSDVLMCARPWVEGQLQGLLQEKPKCLIFCLKWTSMNISPC